MYSALTGFIAQLRDSGLAISTGEAIDAAAATRLADLTDRDQLRASLASVLVKHHSHRPAFDIVFDAYFSLGRSLDESSKANPADHTAGAPGGGGGPLGFQSDEQLVELLFRALLSQNGSLSRMVATESVTRFAQIEPGRAAGVLLYSHRTLRGVDLEAIAQRLRESSSSPSHTEPLSELSAQMQNRRLELRVTRFREDVEAEIRRRLVADRGAEAVARTLRIAVPEDVEFMHANSTQLRAMQHAIVPLARKLAATTQLRRRSQHSGPLNMPATIRRSLASGGVPTDVVTRRPNAHKPQIVVLADISGSVASFAGFTLMFVSAIGTRVAKVRSFMFIDGVDEVTAHVARSRNVGETLSKIRENSALIAGDGHTDYGQVLEAFASRWGQQLNHRTTVLVLGDARSNYRPSGVQALEAISRRTSRVLWLNPEPKQYWDTGDSIMSTYAPHCSAVFECRTIRQLEQIAAQVV